MATMKDLSASRFRWAAVFGVMVINLALSACSDKPDAKDTIMDLFTALHTNDTSLVRRSIDFGRAWASVKDDLRQPEDSLLADIPWGERLFASLTGNGDLRQRWTKMQVVINKTDLFGDSASVEVSFIDRKSGMHFYNKMGLTRKGDRWVIVAFRTL